MSANATTMAGELAPPRQAAVDSVYKKITLRLIPFLAILWILAWLDRVNIGFAKLQMLDDLKFSEAVYGLGAGIFFLGYFLFEVPSNLLLEKIGAKKTIMRITIGWGITSMLMMFVRTPEVFYFLRFLLGVFEAGFYPGIILFLTYWYPTDRRAKAFGMFMSASALAGVIGGPLAGWIMTSLNGVNGWSGWQWVFLIEGIPSVIAGFVTWFYLTDKPEHAHWLNADEKRLVAEELSKDQAALGHREHSILAALRDPKVWQLILIYFCIIAANSTLTFFGPSVVKEVGFASPVAVGWIMAGAYLCGAAGMILNGFSSDRHKEARYHCGLAALLGAVAMATLGTMIPHSPLLSLLALTLAIVGTMSAIPVFWQVPNYFLSGSAAAAGIALINSVANLAGFGAPYAMGLIKTSTGQMSPGLYAVAIIEALATVFLLYFIPRRGSGIDGKR
ncbi:D-galactonate transporter [Plasticicumulans lactativorans]|uniref:D-galactonate transporter n=1 Tax=Plasticicumulans lactativorans TaxID=1133106 RepID=A0A4V2SD05_9GAMM|nr:MFS transporter [Plasticicumulans lactativorans]TCO81490.1 D-galactonate transporter [Plasticicumulans lactativorans]